MKPHKLAHPNYLQIQEAIERGEKWYWIQVTYGCSVSTISRFKKRMQLQTQKPKLTDKQRAEIIRLRAQGKLLNEIAGMFGVTDRWVSKLYLSKKAN